MKRILKGDIKSPRNQAILVRSQTLDYLNRLFNKNKIDCSVALSFSLLESMGLIKRGKDEYHFITKLGREVGDFLDKKGWIKDLYCEKSQLK